MTIVIDIKNKRYILNASNKYEAIGKIVVIIHKLQYKAKELKS